MYMILLGKKPAIHSSAWIPSFGNATRSRFRMVGGIRAWTRSFLPDFGCFLCEFCCAIRLEAIALRFHFAICLEAIATRVVLGSFCYWVEGHHS